MRFNIPEQFELGGRIWDVRVVPEGTLKAEDGDGAWGICDPLHAEIKIEMGQPPVHALQTFLHELLHAVAFTQGKEHHCDNSKEHEDLDGAAGLLAQFLRSCKGKAEI